MCKLIWADSVKPEGSGGHRLALSCQGAESCPQAHSVSWQGGDAPFPSKPSPPSPTHRNVEENRDGGGSCCRIWAHSFSTYPPLSPQILSPRIKKERAEIYTMRAAWKHLSVCVAEIDTYSGSFKSLRVWHICNPQTNSQAMEVNQMSWFGGFWLFCIMRELRVCLFSFLESIRFIWNF